VKGYLATTPLFLTQHAQEPRSGEKNMTTTSTATAPASSKQSAIAATIVASVTSQPEPLEGKKHESSPNFRFSNLPGGGPVRVEISNNPNSANISFVLWRNVNNLPDVEIPNDAGTMRSGPGSTYAANRLSDDESYFIGDPDDAGGQTFLVTFKAS
jgi:hypothetical protein